MTGVPAVPAALLLLLAWSAAPQTADTILSFEVASVKPAAPLGPLPANPIAAAFAGSAKISGGPGTDDPERFSCLNARLALVVRLAYDLQRFEIDGPDWIDSEKFDIVAKVPPGATKRQLQWMLQDLLAQRFGMIAHFARKPMPMYALVVGKGALKLQASEGAGDPVVSHIYPDFKHLPRPNPPIPAHVVFRNVTMGDLAYQLSRLAPDSIDRKVVDETGLAGAYDFALQWFNRYLAEKAGGPTIFESLEKQLGLKLESRKAPVPMLVIEKVLRIPTEN